MTRTRIDGKAHAATLRAVVAAHVSRLRAEHEITPGLAVVLVGEDPASEIYVRNKRKQSLAAGILSREYKLPAATSEGELLAIIDMLNRDPEIHGILVQLPLPDHLTAESVINAIAPEKDVDGFTLSNVGRLGTGQTAMIPCTPLGCLMILRKELGEISGAEAVVVGRSNIVGKPMAHLLLQQSCTVTQVHSRSRDPAELTRRADIVVTAVGRPGMVQGSWLKRGATVIDVGINRLPATEPGGKSRLVGDCHFETCAEVAGAITPVPGGVGPMTIACLLANTVVACCRRNGLPVPDDLTA